MTQTNNEREAFEAWYKDKFGVDVSKYILNGIYYSSHVENIWGGWQARAQSPISQNEQKEAVAERDKLGYAVVEVIGKLDEIIEVAEDIEFNDFAHIAIPLELWNELKDALELMPERADNYTSTPTQSLAEHDNDVIERIALALENAEGEFKALPDYVALVRALKNE